MIDNLGLKPSWQPGDLSHLPRLESDQLHVWWLPLSLSDAQTDEAIKLLSDIQRDKYSRRSTFERKRAYLAGRYYLLTLLSHYTRTPASDIMLSYSRLNKPYLRDECNDLRFNFTDTRHAGISHGAFVFSRDCEVGIDIESRSRRSNFAAIAENRYTPAEIDFVTEQSQLNYEKCIAIWTRKEAFGKATGKGINFKMNEQNLSSESEQTLDFFDPENKPWRLLQLQFGDELIACVVHQSHQKLELKTFHCLES